MGKQDAATRGKQIDIAHASDTDSVIKNGVIYPANSILR
jgi:hypothetical protein